MISISWWRVYRDMLLLFASIVTLSKEKSKIIFFIFSRLYKTEGRIKIGRFWVGEWRKYEFVSITDESN